MDNTILGNTIESYLWFAGIILVGLVFKALISRLLSRLLFKIVQKYSSGVSFEKFLGLLKAPFSLFVLFITFYLAFDRLEFPAEWKLVPAGKFGLRLVLYKSFQISIIISLTWILLRLADFFGLILMEKAEKTESKSDDQLVPFIKETLKIIIATFSFFFILGAIFKVNIASLIAGLGIGGLAVALAAKETLENLLGSFAIFLDKPFQIGDYIKFDNTAGTVEKIGFRSTRLRTDDRSLLTVPNKKLVDSGVDNLSMRTERRVRFSINLSADTPLDKVNEIITQIEYHIRLHPEITEEVKVRLFDIGNQSYTVLINYYMKPLEWNVYVDVKNDINVKILEILKNNDSKIARHLLIGQQPVL